MKNLKRTLALVLAVVMCIGFATIASAAFTDAEDIKYPEAVDVLSSIGVINGFEDGSFKPEGTLTRAQAAKIIAYLVGADTITGTPTFDDCKDHWAASNIAYCASEGIVNGVGDNKFDPEGTLTGYAFAKMCIGILGYKADAEGMTGANWEIGVAKLIKANGLAAGIEGFDGTKAITRQEACQMALNMLQADMVEYPGGGVNITAGDVSISVDTQAEKTGSTFMEEYFPKLKKDTDAADEAGRPAVEWTNAGETIGLYPQEAIKTLVIPAGNKKTVEQLLTAAKLKISDDYAGEVDLDYTPYAGNVGEFFADAEGKVVKSIGYSYYPLEITKVTELKKTDPLFKAGATVKYTVEGFKCYDEYVDKLDEPDEYVAELGTLEKGDVVVGKAAWSAPLAEFEKAELVEGKVSSYTATSYTIGGTKYDMAMMFSSTIDEVNFKSEYKLYLDPNGFAIYLTAEEEAAAPVSIDDVVYVVAYPTGPAVNDQGDEVYYVKTIDMKGEYKLIKTATEPSSVHLGYFYVYDAKKDTFKPVYDTDSLDYDWTSSKVTPSSKSIEGEYSGKLYLASDVKYIFITTDKSGNYKSATAYDSVTWEYDDAIVLTVEEGSNTLAKVIVNWGEYKEAADTDVIYLTGKATGEVNANGKVFEAYTLEGEKTTLTLDQDSVSAGFYEYAEEDGAAEILDTATFADGNGSKDGLYQEFGKVTVYNGMISIDDIEDATLADDCVVVDIIGAGLDTVEDVVDFCDEAGNIEAVLVVSGKKVVTIFVLGLD